jgi:hypothetical protein
LSADEFKAWLRRATCAQFTQNITDTDSKCDNTGKKERMVNLVDAGL